MSESSDEHLLLLRAAVAVTADSQRALEIVSAPDTDEHEVIGNLKSRYGFNDLQARSVLALQLRSFTAAKHALLVRELNELDGGTPADN